MKYTIKDLSEGKCAVINDGRIGELREVLGLVFGGKSKSSGEFKYYFKYDSVYTCSDHTTLPTQSVKDFLVETKYKGKAVHCETQEQWDFACDKSIKSSRPKEEFNTSWRTDEIYDCFSHNFNSRASKEYYAENGYQLISFQEWLDENGYVFEKELCFKCEEDCNLIAKLTTNNEVIISPVEEKTYSREEVETLIIKFSDYADSCIDHEGIMNACCSIGGSSWDEEDWIKENL